MRQRGQISVEYLLMIAIVIVVLVYMGRPSGEVSRALNQVIDQQANDVRDVSDRIFN